MKREKQSAFSGFKGVRKKVGRKRKHSPGVAHTTRERVGRYTPLHINFKIAMEKGTLRNKTVLKLLAQAIAKARGHRLGIVHFSLQHNHVHLLIESPSNITLTKGMRSLIISLVMRLNRYWKKGGQRLKERYHLHVLRSRREIINARNYVRQNHIRHSGKLLEGSDAYSSWSKLFFTPPIAGILDPPLSRLLLPSSQ